MAIKQKKPKSTEVTGPKPGLRVYKTKRPRIPIYPKSDQIETLRTYKPLEKNTSIGDDEIAVGEDGKKYPPPKEKELDKVFVKRWHEFLPDVVARKNFKKGHLAQLEILCDLYSEVSSLTKDINESGYTFVSEGRNGSQEKQRPAVTLLQKARAEIRQYSKVLGLLLVKDTSLTDEDGEDQWD